MTQKQIMEILQEELEDAKANCNRLEAMDDEIPTFMYYKGKVTTLEYVINRIERDA